MRILVAAPLAVLFILASSGCVRPPAEVNDMLDPTRTYTCLIRGGNVIDGTGAPGRPADVLVDGDRIAFVGEVPSGSIQVDRVIDATGKVVTPGFIDAHCHGDPFTTPDFHNYLAMGVTTICLGQDGDSPEEEDLTPWMDRVDARHPGVNIAMFVGHGTVRTLAGIGLKENPSDEEIARMCDLVARAMDDGCFGLTTGLEYDPGRFADESELIALAKPVCQRDGLIMSHMRTEDDPDIAGALAELIAQGVGGGCDVHVSHMKVTFGKRMERVDQLFAQMEAARRKGIHVTADLYPYTASHTTISIVYPDWARPPYDFASVVKERRPELEQYLRQRIALRNGPEATLFTSKPWAGKTLAQVADELGKPFEDVLIDDIQPGGASAAYFVIDERLMERLLADPHVVVSSDGSPTMLHPRGHGAFARVIRKYVVEKKLFTLEQAIHKMTGQTAEITGLDRVGRGRVDAGFHADLLIFDPVRVRDTATYEDPHQLAEGFDTILVNGHVIRDNGAFSSSNAGRVARKGESP